MGEIFRFDDFVWDPSGPALYHSDKLVENVGKRSLQVLGVFVRQPNQLVSHQEVLDAVWGEDNVTVTPDNVHQAISQLRRALRSCAADRDYFKSKKGIGYTFTAPVRVEAGEKPVAQSPPPSNRRPRRLLIAVLVLVLATAMAVGTYALLTTSRAEAEIKQLIVDSQRFESLILYEHPESFNEDDLDRFWIADDDPSSNGDRARIRATVKRMLERRYHYGPETKCDRLDFEFVKLNATGDLATVRTLEQWSTTSYGEDGTLMANKMIGPYFVDYTVKKVNGRWLIDRSSTGRMVRPTPRLVSVEPIERAQARTPFAVRVIGVDLQPDAVYLEIRGPGCPESNPCSVTNTTLRAASSLSDQKLDNVVLTLESGTYQMIARNADSPPSDPVTLIVP